METHDITVQVGVQFRPAVSSNRALAVRPEGRYSRIVNPLVKAYEVVVLY